MYGIHHRPALRRCLVAAAAALAGSGLIGAAAQSGSTSAPAAPAAAAVTTAAQAHPAAAAVRVAPAQAAPAAPAQPAIGPCQGADPSCCGGPLGAADQQCGQPLVSDPTGQDNFMVNDCSSATYVAIGTVCATGSAPDSVAVAPTGQASGGELAVSVTGPASACGGPVPVAVSGGPSQSCKGSLPSSAREGGVSVNGG